MADKNSDNADDQKSKQTSTLEWIVAAVGLILVIGTIGFMIYEALTSKDAPPKFETSVERIDEINSGYRVIFKTVNEGEKTAADVRIEGELKDGTQSVEKSETTISYAPSKSEVRGGLFFKNNPQQLQMEVRVAGYSEP